VTSKSKPLSRENIPLKLPNSIKKAAQRLAKEDGVSLNQWIAAAVAEKVGVVEWRPPRNSSRSGLAMPRRPTDEVPSQRVRTPECEDKIR
jgi:HicB family